MRYSVLRCAELAALHQQGGVEEDLLRFEGLEDLDALANQGQGLRVAAGDELVQVKSSIAGWTWGGLADPVQNFLEAHRIDAELRFRLVINFTPWGELAELLELRNQNAREQARVNARFRGLVRRLGGTNAEADGLLSRLVLEPLLEEDLQRRTRLALSEACGAADILALDALEAILASRVLEWSSERKTIGAADVLETVRDAREGIQRAERYQAVEHRWVGPAVYARDAVPGDFFAGKRVRIGHVVEGLDVPRPHWMERIAKVFATVPVCVIRAPSGHGKSTLAFRYAVEHWPASQTITVRSAGTAEEVAAISDYLRYRATLGAPVRVLVDAEYDTRRWAEVAQAAAAVGAQVLVTARAEDWQRYQMGSLTAREIVEPVLDSEEAGQIFSAFKKRGLIHPEVRSSHEAYERLRSPHLLLEFVYLVTHGQMLEDRLRDQVRAFAGLGEDPAKKRLLRLVSLANALGAPVPIDAALRVIPLRDDPQDVIGTLIGEYVGHDDSRMVPLHWVRSDHLSRILHEGGIPPVIETVAQALDVIPADSLPFFVANAFRRDDLDRDAFLDLLVLRFGAASPELLVRVVEGLFEGGERDFFLTNRARFEEAYEILGANGVSLLATEVSPMLHVGALRRIAAVARDRPEAAAHQLLVVRDQLVAAPRGMDWVGRFLQAAAPQLRFLDADSGTGKLLDWCALARVQLPKWPEVRDHLVADDRLLSRGLEAVCDFAQGLFRFDRAAYDIWYNRVRADLLPFLQLETECVTLELMAAGANEEPVQDLEQEEQERRDREDHGAPVGELAIMYFVDPESAVTPNDQSVRRLEVLRRALPFAGRFNSSGRRFLPAGLAVPLDDTQKAMPRWNLPFPSDVAKNVVSRRVVEAEFAVDTQYALQEAWYSLRTCALRLVRAVATIVESLLERRPYSLDRLLGPGEILVRQFEDAVRDAPTPSEEELELLGPLTEELRAVARKRDPGTWANHLQWFRAQFWNYTNTNEERDGRLTVDNFLQARDHLSGMQAFFHVLFRDHGDCFGARALDSDEQHVYSRLDLLLEGWIIERPPPGPGRAIERVEARRRERDAEALERVSDAFQAHDGAWDEVVLPTAIHRAPYISTLPLGVPVRDPLNPIQDLLFACTALEEVADVADTFWLFPLKNGGWVGSGAHYLSARILRGHAGENDLAQAVLALAVPVEPPAEIVALLAGLPQIERPEPNLRQVALALALGSQVYVEQRDAISELTDADQHPFLVQLQARLRTGLRSMEDEIRTLSRRVNAAITALAEDRNVDTTRARSELLRWTIEVEEATTSDVISARSSARRTPDEINDVAEIAQLVE